VAIRQRVPEAVPQEWIHWFQWSDTDAFVSTFTGRAFPTPEAVREAWPAARRAVWLQTHRFMAPRAAAAFDAITVESREYVLSTCQVAGPFDFIGTLERLSVDRGNLAAFERRERIASAELRDILTLFRADLDAIEETARQLTAWTGPEYLRPYPHSLGSAKTYGEGITR